MRHATRGLLLAILVPALMATTIPTGSLTTFGATSVSGVSVQSGTAVFPGDVITTGPSSAVFNLPNGRTVQIGPNSALRISKDSTVDILKGMSRIQAKSGPFVMLASNWRLQGQPDGKSGLLTADVVRESDGQVSLNVSSGKIVASSFRGNVVMVAEAGRPVMLPSEPPSTGPSDPPQAGGSGSGGSGSSGSGSGNNKALIIGAFVVGAVGLAVGAAALASQPTDQSSTVASLQASIATLNGQIAALNTQTANLLANLNAVASAAAASAALTAKLNTQIGILVAAQGALASAQAQVNALVAKLAAIGSLSAADQTALAAAQAIVVAQGAIIATAAAASSALITQINSIVIPSNFKP